MLSLVIAILIGGLIVWAVYAFAPIPRGFKVAVYVVVVVCLIVYVADRMGVRFRDTPVPQIRN